MANQKKDNTMQPPTTPKSPPPAAAAQKATTKTKKPRHQDTRAPDVIFAARFNREAKLMRRRFEAFAQLGNAKRAKPTPEQHEQAAKWLQVETAKAIEELGRKLRAQTATVKDEAFVVLSEGASTTPATSTAQKQPAAG